MAETLGSLCDKFTIVKLKQYHSDDKEKLASLSKQQQQLASEIEELVGNAASGAIPIDKLTFCANKVFKRQGNEVEEVEGSIGNVFGILADVNCQLWHEQEKVYDFENVLIDQKDKVVKQLATLNLKRTKCIDAIDSAFVELLKQKK